MTTFQFIIVLLIMAALVAFYETRQGRSSKKKETKLTQQSAKEALEKLSATDISVAEDRGVMFTYQGLEYLIETDTYPLIRIAFAEDLTDGAAEEIAKEAVKQMNEIASSIYMFLEDRSLFYCYPSIIPTSEVLEESLLPITKYLQAARGTFVRYYQAEAEKTTKKK